MYEVPAVLQSIVDQADGWLELRCPERALELLSPLLAEPAARHAGLVLRIRALSRLGDYRTALRDLDELHQTGTVDDWVDLTEAWCRRRIDDLPGAIRCTERLVARNQRSDIGHFNLACYLALTGERDRAIDVLSLACGLNAECRDFARDEPDFDGLRNDARFRELLRQAAADGDGAAAPPKPHGHAPAPAHGDEFGDDFDADDAHDADDDDTPHGGADGPDPAHN